MPGRLLSYMFGDGGHRRASVARRKKLTPADKLLDHYDRVAGGEPRFVCTSDDGASTPTHVAIYRDFPEPGAVTGFTVGLSLFHPPGGGHKELTISMRDADDVWAFACGYVAFKLRETCTFVCGDTINFRERIAPASAMSAFVMVHPLWIPDRDAVVDIGVRAVEIAQLVPLYESERAWLDAGGELRKLLRAFPGSALMEPLREAFAPE
jgi:hypothetical protein